MNYIHHNGMIAKPSPHKLFDGPRYNVQMMVGNIGYTLFQVGVSQQELLDFGFKPEEEKEDWINQVLDECMPLTELDHNYGCNIITKYSREKIRQAILKHLPKSKIITNGSPMMKTYRL